jgi:hypothetical protein
VTMTALSQSGVFGAASSIMLRSDAGPMVERVLEPRITCEAPCDDAALARALADRRSATENTESVIVSALEGLPTLCEQRGEHDPTVAWQ